MGTAMAIAIWICVAGLEPKALAQPVDSGPPAPLSIPRLETPVTLEQFLDLRAGEEPRGGLTHIAPFIQRAPSDGSPATEQTDVYLARDSSRLYVVFVASDRDPAKVRARMERREAVTLDEDAVGFYLDTFNDRRRAYQFETNALGIQDDSLYSEDTGIVDDTFDTVWDSRGALTDRGFVVWMSIPFNSLRFPAEGGVWRFAFWRWLPRRSEGSWWPRVTLTTRGILSQAAAIKAPDGISGNRKAQFIPYANWRAFRAIDQRIPAQPVVKSDAADAKAGLDAKLIMNDSIVLDATVNPDFAQVESDEPQSVVNQRFEVFFPERRPFFTENSNYFALPLTMPNEQFLFTRRIQDPQVGARLTGKTGPYSIGAIVTDDRGPGESVPDADPAAGDRAFTGVARISREFAGQSNIGAIATERRFHGTHSRLIAGDFLYRIDKNWSASAIVAKTWNAASQQPEATGTDLESRLQRQSREWNYDLRWVDRSPAFRTDLGFVPRADQRVITQAVSYTSYAIPGFRDVKAELILDKAWDASRSDLFSHIQPTLTVDFADPTSLSVYHHRWTDNLRPTDYPVLQAATAYRQQRSGVSVNSRHFKSVGFTIAIEAGDWINYVPAPGQPPALVRAAHAQANVTVRPVGRLQIASTYLLDESSTREIGTVFSSNVFRSNWSWQFARELSLRVIGQYNSIVSNTALTSQPTVRSFNADVLITYLVHPGTALYVGYTSDFRRPSLIAAEAAADRFDNDGRQAFVKLSYLLRR